MNGTSYDSTNHNATNQVGNKMNGTMNGTMYTMVPHKLNSTVV